MRFLFVISIAVIIGVNARGVETAADEATAQEWIAGYFGEHSIRPPCSFLLDGKTTTGFDWSEGTHSMRRLDNNRTEHAGQWEAKNANLVMRCVAVEYTDFPAVEWKLFLSNNGKEDTPIIENVQAIDARFSSNAAGEFKLFYSRGSHERADDFEPIEKALDEPIHLAPFGGRSSDGVLPFFNLIRPDGAGVIMGIGWTGQWAASFAKEGASVVNVQAGMELTHLRLHPGEEIRTPAILLLFWKGGDSIEGNNLLRRLLLKHYTPMPGGKPVNPPVAVSPHGTIGFSDSAEANMIHGIENVAAHAFPVDTWWIDAGWNGDAKDWARSVGSWEANMERYPHGMKPVADAAHAHGLRFLLWVEPERVMPDTWLFNNHPEWILSPAGLPPELQYQDKDRFRLLNLGNPEALAWAKATFSTVIGDVGIDIYRQDFNMTPLYYWRNGEAADRQGMNEIRHVTGLYDLYDTLAREHPGLLIDNCASGGRRIDFEIMRRALSLFRSDLCWEPIAEQSMNYGISFWMPITGVGAVKMDNYNFRSGMGSHVSLALDYYNQPEMWAPAAEMIRQYQKIRHLFRADFHPLTPYSRDKDKWIAWQYHSPETSEGLVQAFRRDACPVDSLCVKLRGLDAEQKYTVTDLDKNAPVEMAGKELIESGLKIEIAAAPGAALVHYAAAK